MVTPEELRGDEAATQSKAEAGQELSAQRTKARREHQRGLWLVGIFKLSKALFFIAVGAGALHLIHRDLGDMVMRVVDFLRLDPESRMVNLVLDKAHLVTHHQLRRASLFAFLYAGLCLVEGTGLMLEKEWAEYLTVVLTTLALPWELYEMAEHFSVYKVGLVLANVVVLLYLLWVLKRKRAQMRDEAGAAG